MQPIVTARLLLRPFVPSDLEDVYREIFSDAEVCHFYCGRTRTREQTQEWLHYRIAEWKYSSFGRVAVVLRQTDTLLGFVGLESYVNRFARFKHDPAPIFNEVEVELSFALGKSYWGQGYAFEASQALVRYAFDELKIKRLVGSAALDNPRSAKLQERLGYKVELAADDSGYITILENDIS
ncbi:MAG: GNAT family N-acetyltransferase [Abitibacteriaceae bacterium]|nr:GNAT family N-acetyltransferase [Abditibacteriaceae bacterium]